MRYKPHAATRRRTLHVPRLDGGMNLYDPPSAVADNQLTACTNMWWERGALRVRPGLISAGANIGSYNIVQPIGDDELLFIDYRNVDPGGRRFEAMLQRADGTVSRFGRMAGDYLHLDHRSDAPLTAFGCHAPQGLGYDFLFFFGGGDILTYEEETGYISYAAPYVPQVITDGAPTVALQTGTPAGTALEDPNRLSNKGIATYTTDGKGTYFYLPSDYRSGTMAFSLTVYDHEQQTTLQVDPTTAPAFTPAALGIDKSYTAATIRCDRTAGNAWFRLYIAAKTAAGGTDILPLPALGRNNLRVDMTGHGGYNPAAVCRMTMATWYGGTYGGILDGSRLFIAGDSRDPRRLMWSQADNPLYFPVSNSVLVGDSHTAITALAKQDDRLVIFKQQEIYCADYVGKSDPVTTVASDETERRAARAYFPLTLLSATVGCDCPATVRAVNNRLVWMTAAGKLYTLTAVDIHKSRNVREISTLIEPALVAHPLEERRAAGGGAYDGRYLLAIGRTVYVLDCRSPAFVRFGQYADEQSALRSLVYHRWEMPLADRYRFITGAGVTLFVAITANVIRTARPGGTTDVGAAIESSFATRRFPCDDPTRRMSVEAAYLETSDPERPVRVHYVTDEGDRPAAVITPADIPVADRITPRRLAPAARRIAAFGLRCEGKAPYAVGSLTVVSRQNGTIR